jgi:hypothetical protein
MSATTISSPPEVDSRVDIFEYNGTFKDYLDATKLKNTLFVLDKYRIRYVFFQRDTPLVYLLEHTGEWKIQYQDDSSVLLEAVVNFANCCRCSFYV